MKRLVVVWFLVASSTPSARGQDHLEPEPGVLSIQFQFQIDYHLQLREVLKPAFEPDVKLLAVVLPSFEVEYAVGVKVTDKGAEVFVVEPKTQVWESRFMADYEIKGMLDHDANDQPIPLEKSESYRDMKARGVPADYRKIQIMRKSRAVPNREFDRLHKLWERSLLAVRHPVKQRRGEDGTKFHLSAFIPQRGNLSGETWSPDDASRMGRLVKLVDTMADFARGKAELTAVTDACAKAEE
jgi:hypothetical protein